MRGNVIGDDRGRGAIGGYGTASETKQDVRVRGKRNGWDGRLTTKPAARMPETG